MIQCCVCVLGGGGGGGGGGEEEGVEPHNYSNAVSMAARWLHLAVLKKQELMKKLKYLAKLQFEGEW